MVGGADGGGVVADDLMSDVALILVPYLFTLHHAANSAQPALHLDSVRCVALSPLFICAADAALSPCKSKPVVYCCGLYQVLNKSQPPFSFVRGSNPRAEALRVWKGGGRIRHRAPGGDAENEQG